MQGFATKLPTYHHVYPSSCPSLRPRKHHNQPNNNKIVRQVSSPCLAGRLSQVVLLDISMDTFGYSDIRPRVNIPLSDRHSSNLISPTESSTTSNEIPDDSGHGSSISGQTSDASVNDTSGLKADKQKGNRVQVSSSPSCLVFV